MKGESHRRLGLYLADKYMQGIPATYVKAFLTGCIQPDRNPVTYIKGSLHAQWFRGHNFENARWFMARIARRLERKSNWNLLDYYTLGKLIHYTADAFTSAHNSTFSTGLNDHNEYERKLQDFFLEFLKEAEPAEISPGNTIMDTIVIRHREYSALSADIHRDARYALGVCCCIISTALTKSNYRTDPSDI